MGEYKGINVFLIKMLNVLGISKHYSSCNFPLILSKLYEDIAYYGGTQASTFLNNWPSFKNFVAL